MIGRIREIGPSLVTDGWTDPLERGEPFGRGEPVEGDDEPDEQPQPQIPEPTMLSSYFG